MDSNKPRIEDEIDFKDVLKNPKRWFGLIYPLFLVVIIVIGTFYIQNMDTFTKNSIPAAIDDTSKLWKELSVNPAKNIAGIDLNIIRTPSKEFLEKGKTLFTQTCQACHGEKGMGDGVAGAALNPKPRNFTLGEGWKNGTTLTGIFKTLKEGIAGSGMVAYEFIPLEDRLAIIYYVRSLAPHFQPVTAKDIDELNAAEKLGETRTEPAQITSKMAISVISNEKSAMEAKAKTITETIKSSSNQVVAKSVTSPAKAAFAVLNSASWAESPEKFLTFAVYGSPLNGFNPKVSELSKEELGQLYTFMCQATGN